ncbi:ABC transporter permease [Sphingobacterium sp. DN00404]|uniref:ABC transporter permease n=1 Tax=Sphingobacterium micropteri TaxID=2763501 RepID=A0ABR7YS52_9SPHI|nr:ABC transporter permease [Sphingobacterium micropteri]MBD1434163.1 ABC transporter permease [Sphingobacterium micropteri]
MIGVKLTFRKLWRNRLFTALNILGLAIGISACWIIFRIVHYEFSFDKSHPDKENIYQVVSHTLAEGKESSFGGVPLSLYPYAVETFGHLAQIVPIYEGGFQEVMVDKNHQAPLIFEEPTAINHTVTAYFDMVPYQWIAGNPKTAISQPNQVVLTQSRAKQYFANTPLDDILGKTLKYDTILFTVTGIVADLDKPSSFTGKEFMFIPQDKQKGRGWLERNSAHQVFINLPLQHKDIFLDNINVKNSEEGKEAFATYNFKTSYGLLPLTEKHFTPGFGSYVVKKEIVYGLIGVGIFLLLLACINYINLSTAQVPFQAKEIGIRKTLGEKGFRLTATFLWETLFICLIALLLSLPLVHYFEWQFKEFLPPNIQDYNDWQAISLFLIILIGVLTLLAGLYPAYLSNKVNVVDTIKVQGIGKLSFGNISLRKTLIVFQFVIAQVFVIGTFIVSAQINYMMNTDLGFDKHAIVTLGLPYKAKHDTKTDPLLYKRALEQYPEFEKISLGSPPISDRTFGMSITIPSDTGETHVQLMFKSTDANYFDLYNIETLAGRAPQLSDSIGSIFLNESARIKSGFKTNESAIGQIVKGPRQDDVRIQGVFKDFHTHTLRAEKAAMALEIDANSRRLEAFNIKLPDHPSQWQKALTTMGKEWKTVYPNTPFDYKFYDEKLASIYESDMRQAKIINLSTIVTIILSCLGLIGLVTLTAFQRTKEIGIRKVLGSSIARIIMLLSKDYIKLIVIAIIIATPLGWWTMNKWLEDFAYRIDIRWWMLLSAGIVTVIIALLSVSYQAWKAARTNPVDSLRDE